MNAVELLEQQHREVEKLFEQVLKEEAPEERAAVAMEIVEKLSTHATLEEEIFYPAYREATGTQKGEKLTLEAYEEHRVVKMLLGEIPDLDGSEENFEAKMTVLKELVEHHVEEEEEEMFPDAEKKLGKARLEELGAEMEEQTATLDADDESEEVRADDQPAR